MSGATPTAEVLSTGNIQTIWSALGISEDDLNKMNKLQHAEDLVKQGKLKPEVFDRLLTMTKKNIEVSKSGKKHGGRDRNRKPLIEVPAGKPIIEGYLEKRPKSSNSKMISSKNWKRRYFALYKHSLIYYKHKSDSTPKGMLQLNADFYVQDLKGSKSVQNSKGEGGFVLSDMNHSFYLRAESIELKTFWMHTVKTVLRKLQEDVAYFDTPVLMDKPQRTADQIQSDYEKRMKAYKESIRKKPKRGSRFFGTLKKKNKAKEAKKREQVEADAQKAAIEFAAQELEAEELEHAKNVEKSQTMRERELKQEVMKWKRLAEENNDRVEEVKKELQDTLAELRRQAKEREDDLIAERDAVKKKLEEASHKRKSFHPGTMDRRKFEEFEKERKALQAKLDALQSALQVDLGNLDWDGTLEDAEQKMRALVPKITSEDPKVSQEAQAEFDQWDKIIRNHGDYKQREKEKMEQWERDNKPKNLKAADEMRELVPPQVVSGITLDDLRKNKKLQPSAARRILKTQILKFLYMDRDTIAKIHIADLSSRYVPQGLDIVELRAVYSTLPDEFQNDRDGKKKVWMDQFRNKLMDFTKREKEGTLTRPEKRNPAYLAPGAHKPVGGARGGGKRPKPKNQVKLRGANGKKAGKIDTSALQQALAAKLAGGGPPLGPKSGGPKKAGGLPPPPIGGPFGKIPAAVLASRQKMEEDGGGSSGPPVGGPFGKIPAAVLASRQKMEEAGGSGGAPKATSSKSPKSGSSSKGSSSSSKGSSSSSKGSSSPSKGSSGQRRPSKGKPPRKKESKVAATATAEEGLGFFAKAASYFAPPPTTSIVVESDDDANSSEATGDTDRTLSQMRADAFGNRIEEGIQELCQIIRKNGAFDQAEGGIATMTFGDLFELYEGVNDMLVGILMRAKKRKKVRYQGDMLFQGIHDKVKITLLS